MLRIVVLMISDGGNPKQSSYMYISNGDQLWSGSPISGWGKNLSKGVKQIIYVISLDVAD